MYRATSYMSNICQLNKIMLIMNFHFANNAFFNLSGLEWVFFDGKYFFSLIYYNFFPRICLLVLIRFALKSWTLSVRKLSFSQTHLLLNFSTHSTEIHHDQSRSSSFCELICLYIVVIYLMTSNPADSNSSFPQLVHTVQPSNFSLGYVYWC